MSSFLPGRPSERNCLGHGRRDRDSRSSTTHDFDTVFCSPLPAADGRRDPRRRTPGVRARRRRLRATGAQALLHAGLVYGADSSADPAASLVWLDTLWQAWQARYGQDAHMQRHIVVFAARILRGAAATPAQAQAAAKALQGLSIAGLT